jgi:hypothetical protein
MFGIATNVRTEKILIGTNFSDHHERHRSQIERRQTSSATSLSRQRSRAIGNCYM